MAKFFGLDKISKVFEIIKFNGGIRASLYKLYRTDDLRIGTLVGSDKYGHKYYENKAFFYGRNRWVDYSEQVGMEYDGSQVPPEWSVFVHNYVSQHNIHVITACNVIHEWSVKYFIGLIRHRWLHYMTDDPPTKVPPVQHRWTIDHVENWSGTSKAYTPYSTTRPKIEAWVPPKK